MVRPKNKEQKGQLNLFVPLRWKERLQELAREISFKENKDITYLDLAEQAIRDVYNLDGECKKQ